MSKFNRKSVANSTLAGIALAIANIAATGCATTQTSEPINIAGGAMVVDCSLPGQIRKLGTQITYITPRRSVRISASECEIRGGRLANNGTAKNTNA